MKHLLLASLALFAGCASASKSAPASERSEPVVSDAPDTGLVSAQPVEIYVDSGDSPLGADTLSLIFNRNEVRILAVEPAPGFAAPNFSRVRFSSGELVLSAFQLDPGPRGRTPVALVTFESYDGNPSLLTVRLVNLYDAEARPIRGQAGASRDRVP